MRMRDACIGWLEDVALETWPSDGLAVFVSPLLDGIGAALTDVLVVWQARGARKDAAGVCSVEGAGLGGRIEDLGVGELMDWEIVDALVGCNIFSVIRF